MTSTRGPARTSLSPSPSPAPARPLNRRFYRRNAEGRLRSAYLGALKPNPRHPATFISPLAAGSIDDIREGRHPVYEVYAGGRQFTGLAECVRIEVAGRPPVYVLDHHHLAYFAWHEARALGLIKPGATLIHIDLHSDNKRPAVLLRPRNLAAAARYVVNHLEIDNFIIPATGDGTVGDFWDFHLVPGQPFGYDSRGKLAGSGSELGNPQENPEFTLRQILDHLPAATSLILDVDLDAFVETGYCYPLPSAEDFAGAARLLAEIARRAGVVTLATSPGYTLQSVAVQAAKRITREITYLLD